MNSPVEEIVKVDSKGRVTIPLVIREIFDIREGMYLLITANRDEKVIRLVPLPLSSKLVKLRVLVEDRPGVLAKITEHLAELGGDIISTKCVVLKREELGECDMIIDISKMGFSDIEMLAEELRKLEPVKDVKTQLLQA